MIIEIKDIPNGQYIDKIDIHIDFQKSSEPEIITTLRTNPKVEVVNLNSQTEKKIEVPQEMLDGDF